MHIIIRTKIYEKKRKNQTTERQRKYVFFVISKNSNNPRCKQ